MTLLGVGNRSISADSFENYIPLAKFTLASNSGSLPTCSVSFALCLENLTYSYSLIAVLPLFLYMRKVLSSGRFDLASPRKTTLLLSISGDSCQCWKRRGNDSVDIPQSCTDTGPNYAGESCVIALTRNGEAYGSDVEM
jgi:hypothetical protein